MLKSPGSHKLIHLASFTLTKAHQKSAELPPLMQVYTLPATGDRNRYK
jgi:hypothetical protein